MSDFGVDFVGSVCNNSPMKTKTAPAVPAAALAAAVLAIRTYGTHKAIRYALDTNGASRFSVGTVLAQISRDPSL